MTKILVVDCEIRFSVCQERCVIQYRLSKTFLSSHTSIKIYKSEHFHSTIYFAYHGVFKYILTNLIATEKDFETMIDVNKLMQIIVRQNASD